MEKGVLQNLEIDVEWVMKFYFLHMRSDEVGNTLKHSESFHGNVKNF